MSWSRAINTTDQLWVDQFYCLHPTSRKGGHKRMQKADWHFGRVYPIDRWRGHGKWILISDNDTMNADVWQRWWVYRIVINMLLIWWKVMFIYRRYYRTFWPFFGSEPYIVNNEQMCVVLKMASFKLVYRPGDDIKSCADLCGSVNLKTPSRAVLGIALLFYRIKFVFWNNSLIRCFNRSSLP